MLPQDPYVLFSYVNTKLRDAYPSLDALCDDLDVSRLELTENLNAAGFRYDASANQFRPV